MMAANPELANRNQVLTPGDAMHAHTWPYDATRLAANVRLLFPYAGFSLPPSPPTTDEAFLEDD